MVDKTNRPTIPGTSSTEKTTLVKHLLINPELHVLDAVHLGGPTTYLITVSLPMSFFFDIGRFFLYKSFLNNIILVTLAGSFYTNTSLTTSSSVILAGS